MALNGLNNAQKQHREMAEIEKAKDRTMNESIHATFNK